MLVSWIIKNSADGRENERLMKKFFATLLLIMLLGLSVFGAWKTIYISADIDESYALTMAARIVAGDHLFSDMWEPHQMSALLYAPFLAIYKGISGGMTGALVFMRYIGIFLQGITALFLFLFLRKKTPNGVFMPALVAILYFNFLPKQIQSPEFTSLFYWMFIWLMLCISLYLESEKKRWLILAGLCMSGLCMCYPYLVLLFIYVCALIFRKNKKAVWGFVLTCAAVFGAFLIYLAATTGLSQVISNVPNILLDESHEQGVLSLWASHLKDLIDIYGVTAALVVIVHVGRPVLDKKGKHGFAFVGALFILQTIWMLWQFHSLNNTNSIDFFPIVGQLLLVVIYGFATLPKNAEIDGGDDKTTDNNRSGADVVDGDLKRQEESLDNSKEESSRMLATFVAGDIIAVLAILSSSNLFAQYSMSFLMPGVLIGIYLLGEKYATCQVLWTRLLFMGMVLVLTCQVFLVRDGLVRYTANQRKNIFETYYPIQQGVLAGVRLGEFDCSQYIKKQQLLHDYVSDEDVLLYVGADMFLYSGLKKGQIGTGNTISTPSFGKQLMEYYVQHHDRIPTVILIDKEYGADFEVVLERPEFKGFVETYFDLDGMYQDGPCLVLKPRVIKTSGLQ